MANKTFEKCMTNILKDIEKRSNVAYEDKNSVRRYNAAYHRIFANVRYIEDNYPERMESVVALIHHPDVLVVRHIAPILLRLNHTSKADKKNAVLALQKLYDENKFDAVGATAFRINMKDWAVYLED